MIELADDFDFAFSERTRQIGNEAKKNLIIFSPSEDKWNDFWKRIQFECRIFPPKSDQHVYSEQIYLAFHDSDEDPQAKVQVFLQTQKGLQKNPSQLATYFTMHREMESYRKIVRLFGTEYAQNVLGAMHDMVTGNYNMRRDSWFREAEKTEIFHKSMLRSSETFFAFNNAGPLLSGLIFEPINKISRELRLDFKLPTYANRHRIEFGFPDNGPFPGRIVVLIGKNGTGKSQALRNIVRALCRNDEATFQAKDGRPSINRLLGFSSPGQTGSTFPEPTLTDRIPYKKLSLNKTIFGATNQGMGSVILQLARSEETIKNKSRLDLFYDALKAVFPMQEIWVRLRANRSIPGVHIGRRGFPLEELLDGSSERRLERFAAINPNSDLCREAEGKMLALSSGELTYLRFAALICLHIENASLLLYDEPEVHLHPNFITILMALLNRLLEQTGSLAILASHSAYLVREVTKEQVIILRATEENQIQISNPRLQTFGADIGAISHFVFGDELYGRILQEFSKHLDRRGDKESLEYLSSIESQLSPEGYMYLRRALRGK
jgi:ABC-type branched-subunit amino acid transport system ATPase component